MHPSDQQTGTVTTLPFVSSTLGMRQFPVGTVPSAETGNHVMVRDGLRNLQPPMLGMVPATAVDLADRALAPMIFDFDADRDLGFVSGIADGRLWSERGWAHPGFLSAASNAILRRDVQFESPQHWKNTGFEVKLRRPISSGSIIRFAAHIDRLFDSARYRFAVCAIEAAVDGVPVATITNTFAYGLITTD